jgi:competence protein ComEC
VVTARQASPGCAAAVMSDSRLRSQGALALRQTGHGFVLDAVRPKGVDRPWSPAVAGDTAEPDLVRPVAGRPVDATPSETDQQAED